MGCKKLRWTPEMEEVKEKIANSPLNVETWGDIRKVLEHKGYAFFLYTPTSVAGCRAKYSAWRAVEEGDHIIESALPEGYDLVAWHGWGGCGWIAQAKRIQKTTDAFSAILTYIDERISTIEGDYGSDLISKETRDALVKELLALRKRIRDFEAAKTKEKSCTTCANRKGCSI